MSAKQSQSGNDVTLGPRTLTDLRLTKRTRRQATQVSGSELLFFIANNNISRERYRSLTFACLTQG